MAGLLMARQGATRRVAGSLLDALGVAEEEARVRREVDGVVAHLARPRTGRAVLSSSSHRPGVSMRGRV
jgi:hypothetical protein